MVHTGMYVDGTELKMQDGTPIVLRGINHAHSWYREYDETAFSAIEATGANCIRIVLANGDQWKEDSAKEVKKLIEMARTHQMISIVEVHDGTGSDSLEALSKITDYWVKIAGVFKGTENYCILNIANEWVGGRDLNIWTKGYTESIPRLRKTGIKNVIMVDAAGWGQYAKAIREKGREVFESDSHQNTMFSIHMYGTAGGSNWRIKNNLEGATNQGLCVCVGEFGHTHSDGDVKEDYLMRYCENHKIGTIAWSFKGNSGGVEYLDLALDWEGKILSADWGEKAINGKFGIRNTSLRPWKSL